MKRPTGLYYFSWAVILLILMAAVFGGTLKPHGIDDANKISFIKQQKNNETKYLSPPLPPDSTFLLGTDHRGFDLLSLLLNGLKYTLGIIAAFTLLRLVFAVPWGLWVGMTGKGAGFLRIIHKATSTVPAFLFVYPPLAGMYFGIGMQTGDPVNPHSLFLYTVVFLVTVTLFGVIPIAHQVAERARYYNDKQYVEVSRLMGGSITHRMLRHIIPSMRLELLFITLSEFVSVIFLIGQLAVFNIIIGGSETMELDDLQAEIVQVTANGEWVSLLAYGTDYVRSFPWITLVAAAGLSFLILSVQFLLNQLKKRFSGTAGA